MTVFDSFTEGLPLIYRVYSNLKFNIFMTRELFSFPFLFNRVFNYFQPYISTFSLDWSSVCFVRSRISDKHCQSTFSHASKFFGIRRCCLSNCLDFHLLLITGPFSIKTQCYITSLDEELSSLFNGEIFQKTNRDNCIGCSK